jgi:hypothetical protein
VVVSVRDARLPPFTWLANDALDTVRAALPVTRQPGARNALFSVAEAASRGCDGRHRGGYTLRGIAALAGVSERRLRDHLADLETLGLVEITAPRDHAGRDLPKVYSLRDVGSDDSSDRQDTSSSRSDSPADGPTDDSSDPTRACKAVEEEEQETPLPPKGGRSRERIAWREALTGWTKRHLPHLAGDPQTLAAVEQAMRAGRRTRLDVESFLAEWWPQLGTDIAESSAAAPDGADEFGPEQPSDALAEALPASSCRCERPGLASNDSDGDTRCATCGKAAR